MFDFPKTLSDNKIRLIFQYKISAKYLDGQLYNNPIIYA